MSARSRARRRHGSRRRSTACTLRPPTWLDRASWLTGYVLFAGSAPLAIIGFTQYWPPPEWAVVVDALAWAEAPRGRCGAGRCWTSDGRRTARAALHIAVRACTRSTEQSLAGLRHATPRCPSCFEPGGDGQVAGHPRTGHDHAAHAAPTPGSFGSGDRRACKSCCQLESRRVRLLWRYSAMEVRNQLGEVWAII